MTRTGAHPVRTGPRADPRTATPAVHGERSRSAPRPVRTSRATVWPSGSPGAAGQSRCRRATVPIRARTGSPPPRQTAPGAVPRSGRRRWIPPGGAGIPEASPAGRPSGRTSHHHGTRPDSAQVGPGPGRGSTSPRYHPSRQPVSGGTRWLRHPPRLRSAPDGVLTRAASASGRKRRRPGGSSGSPGRSTSSRERAAVHSRSVPHPGFAGAGSVPFHGPSDTRTGGSFHPRGGPWSDDRGIVRAPDPRRPSCCHSGEDQSGAAALHQRLLPSPSATGGPTLGADGIGSVAGTWSDIRECRRGHKAFRCIGASSGGAVP